MHKRHFLVVVGVCLLVRLILLLCSNSTEYSARSYDDLMHQLAADCRHYFVYGWNIANHGTYSLADNPPYYSIKPEDPSAHRTPGYPLLIAVALKVTASPGAAVLLIAVFQQLLGALGAGLCALVAWRFIGRTDWSIVAGILAGLQPHVVRASMSIWSETVFLFFLVLSIYLLIRHFEASKAFNVWLVLAAVSFGFTSFCRPNGNLIALVIVPITLLLDPRFTWRERLLHKVAPFVAAYLLVIAPWIARNYTTLGLLDLSNLDTHVEFRLATSLYAISSGEVTGLDELADRVDVINRFMDLCVKEFNEIHGTNLRQDPDIRVVVVYPPELTGPYSRFVVRKLVPLVFENFGIYVKGATRTLVRVLFGFNKDVLGEVLAVPHSPQRMSEIAKDWLRGDARGALDKMSKVGAIDYLGFAWAGFYALAISSLALVGFGWSILKPSPSVSLVWLLFLITAILLFIPPMLWPIGSHTARYRVLTSPFFAIYAAWCMQRILAWWRLRGQPASPSDSSITKNV